MSEPDRRNAQYAAEFVGTLVLVLAITGFVSASSKALEIFPLAVVHGLALMGIVYTIGSISGAHVNPAVTLALLGLRKIRGRDAGFYILAQFVGAIVGAWLAKEFFLGRGSTVAYGTPGISNSFLQGGKVGLAFLAEAIGGALALGVLIFGPATGASFNPARWFGPALVSGVWDDAWLYILAPIVG